MSRLAKFDQDLDERLPEMRKEEIAILKRFIKFQMKLIGRYKAKLKEA